MIKLFEQFNNEQEIHDICKKYNIQNYTINPDGSIDVDGNVFLYNMDLTEIPLKFNKVNGLFDISHNNITSLEGSPKYVGVYFNCYSNELTSLEGSPNYVGSYFSCSYNKLNALDGSTERVGGHFYCISNNITTLKGFPMIINQNLYLADNPISIIDSSIEIKGDITLKGTNFDDMIKSLSQDKLRILFEHGIDYDIFSKDGTINDSRLEGMFKDFNI